MARGNPSFLAGCPTVGFTGPNGVGKTLVAVSVVINDDIRSGRPVYSTVAIESPWGNSEPLVSMRQLLELESCTVLLDEIAVILSSRDSMHVPKEFDVFLQTMRHRDVTVRWTAPSWMRADKRLREATQVAVGCSFMGKVVTPGEFWPRPRLIQAGALDCTGVGVDDQPEKVIKRRIFSPTMLSGWGAYDTHAGTPKLAVQTGGGSCVDCGGTIPKEACSPDRHVAMGLPRSTAFTSVLPRPARAAGPRR